MMAWIRHLLGLDIRDRVSALEVRRRHNERSVKDAVAAFKQFAKDAER